MASTYSDLKIELIGTGDQTGTWGTTTNNNFSVAIFGSSVEIKGGVSYFLFDSNYFGKIQIGLQKNYLKI